MEKTDNTTQALIGSGLLLFGEYGLNGTSTRMLAQKANVNVSAIAYHFQSKENLYKAVIEHITKYFFNAMSNVRNEAKKKMQSNDFSSSDAKKLVLNLSTKMASIMIENEEVRRFARLIIREQTSPTTAFQIIYDGYMRDFISLISSLVGHCLKIKPDSDEAIIRSHNIIGQIITFVVTREALIRNLGVKKLTKKQIKIICETISSNISCSLDHK